MNWLLVLLVFCGLSYSFEKEDDCSKTSKLQVYEDYGNITITGIFSGRTGENCTQVIDQGLEEMSAAVWTVAALNNYKYLPGVKIGLSLFEACNHQDTAQKALVQAILRESCQGALTGILTTPEIDEKLKPFAETVNKTITRIEHLLNTDTLLEMLMQLLTNLRWTTVNRVIGENEDVLQRFSAMTTDEGICVYDEVLVTDRYGINNEVLYPQDSYNDSFVEDALARDQPLIIVVAKSDSISKLLDEMEEVLKNVTGRWFFVPIDSTFTVPLGELPDNSFVMLPLTENRDPLKKILTHKEIQNDFLNHREATKSPIFLKISSAIIDMLQPFRNVQDMYCPYMDPKSKDPCLEVYKLMQDLKSKEIILTAPKSLEPATPEKIENALSILKILPNDNDETFLYVTTLVKGKKIDDVAISQIFETKTKRFQPTLLIIKDDNVKSRMKRMFQINVEDIKETRKKQKEKKIKKQDPLILELYKNETKKLINGDNLQHPCYEMFQEEEDNSARNCGVCLNFVKYFTKTTREPMSEKQTTVRMDPFEVTWRFRMWVAINASVAFIGVICALAIITFIIFRICKGDILEGSPFFTFLILISVILMYAAILPYSLEASYFWYISICDLRILGPSLTYSILFSLLLSRSLMLASSDQEGGFMSHINGYLQSVLCFFMCGVQIALSAQYWYFDSYLNGRVVNGDSCMEMYLDNKILVLLGYSCFLLGMLICVSPFMFRCKRNYKEGMFFTVAIFLIVLDWSVWVTFYFLLPLEHKDAAVAFGLTATATTILLTVFIPRTYLMVVSIVRDKIANTLPPLSCASAGNISETNYRSNQVLYDSVTVPCGSPKNGISNPNFYSVNPSDSPPSSPKDNFYANQSAIANMSKARTSKASSRSNTPENTYESYESPTSPKNITKF